jgi:hypothetical protein
MIIPDGVKNFIQTQKGSQKYDEKIGSTIANLNIIRK